jgi:hypothetical protein
MVCVVSALKTKASLAGVAQTDIAETNRIHFTVCLNSMQK